ncbi:MAG: gliding motility-associated C-terminal domain-containing protein, partial [Gemmatimonadetes bacterium]|nr:gliding motility-associated C-terminal domain-containing protein [Gemmatimonadota bacterium]
PSATGYRPWSTAGSFEGLDDTAEEGWLQPIFVSNQNLSLSSMDRGGWINSDFRIGVELLPKIINGDHSAAFPDLSDRNVERRVNKADLPVTLILDLGGPFGVDSLSFYPRAGLERAFMRGYQVWVHDGVGLDELKLPLRGHWFSVVKDWKLVAEQAQTDNPFARIKLPLQVVRYVAISDTISLPDPTLWEIDELEVWGNGYALVGHYESDVIDLGDRASLGNLTWSALSDSGSALLIRTRTGQTEDPFVYNRLTGLGLEGEERVTQAQYKKLRPTEKGSIQPDTENWSGWSAPYPPTGKEPFIALAPAQYVQFRIDFQSFSPLFRSRIDSLSVEFSTPLFGREFIAELTPQQVVPGKKTTFTYAMRAILEPEDSGIDGLQVATPLPAEVKEVRINGNPVAYSEDVGADGFAVSFPENRITEHATLLEVDFDTEVLVYGTRFTGRVFDTEREGDIPQIIVPGDATPDIDTDDLLVKWDLDRSLLASVDISQHHLTPNGDGVNDAVEISYSLLQVIRSIQVSVEIFDLSGQRIWHQAAEQANGQYAVSWQGLDDAGQVVPPGLYVYQLVADADQGSNVYIGTLAVAY